MFLRDELPRPSDLPQDAQNLIRIALRDGAPFRIVDLVHSGAATQIVRGRYRNAIVDDVTALEMEVQNGVERRLEQKLPLEHARGLVEKRELPQVGGMARRTRRASPSP